MSLTITPLEIALRLAASLMACALIGLNRTERGEAAGLRTTILVGLASSLSMILANLLVPTAGRQPGMFASLDMMRLPLGVLTGMGFIGGGAILRRGSVVQGVTTAATLWIVTILGLCFGGGEIALGAAGSALALGVLWGLKPVEGLLKRHRQGRFAARIGPGGPSPDEIRARLERDRIDIHAWEVTRIVGEGRGKPRATIRAEFQWLARHGEAAPPPAITGLAELPGVLAVRWYVQ
ncbi:MAG: MgtC/SapB family protein [Isosphaeraceae bacterium]